MTDIGTIVDGKYEVLKELGRGGMSIVYLAMDQHLNKQWAIKEIRKKGNGKKDALVIESLIAEANLIKKLDHPALPRIVDIIDNGETIYIIMDYIEGESLGNILKNNGPQPEEKVVAWAKQLCDVLSYLHNRRPSIIYRDMKPDNVMLRPEGNIKIIDFGIALECTDKNLQEIKPLGTSGYAPQEQKECRPCIQSDIYALGVTMHYLLTGVAPRANERCAPVRQWKPELSESIELIVEKCIRPDPQDRYQSCSELLYDLEHPDLITKEFRISQKRKLTAFCVSLGLAVVLGVSGIGCRMGATRANNQNYDVNIISSDPQKIFAAADIYPERVDAYNAAIDYYKNREPSNEELMLLAKMIEDHSDSLNMKLREDGKAEPLRNPEIAEMLYNMGKLYFAEYDGSFKERTVNARKFFDAAANADAAFGKKDIAVCYAYICSFMEKTSATSEHSLKDFEVLFEKIDTAMDTVARSDDNEANYDRISLYYATMLLINDQAEYMAGVGFEREVALQKMDLIRQRAEGITSTLSYVHNLREKIENGYDSFISNINAKYNEVEKRQMGGK